MLPDGDYVHNSITSKKWNTLVKICPHMNERTGVDSAHALFGSQGEPHHTRVCFMQTGSAC